MGRNEIDTTTECPLLEKESFGELVLWQPYAAKAFFELASKYYRDNFGTLPKSEIDLFMFQVFFERFKQQKIKEGKEYISDLEIAMQLGITPTKVSNYREKLEIRKQKYTASGWINIFMKTVGGLRGEVDGAYVKFALPDKFTKRLLEDALLAGGYYFDSSFNSKALILSERSLFALTQECFQADTALGNTSNDEKDLEDEMLAFLENSLNDPLTEERFPDLREKIKNDELSIGRYFYEMVFDIAELTGEIGKLTGFLPDFRGVTQTVKHLVDLNKALIRNLKASIKNKRKSRKE